MPPHVDDLRQLLGDLNLDQRGHKRELARRLRLHSQNAARPESPPPPETRPPGQDFDAFLVIDVEATCERIEGLHSKLAFSYPNEIIEWPVVLLTWTKKVTAPVLDTAGDPTGAHADVVDDDEWELTVKDEYHSFVKPSWSPQLSPFCTELTGITQADVENAPTYSQVLDHFYSTFILRHNLFTKTTRTAWVTDGPWDLRDFVAKAAHINQQPRPAWLAGRMIDLRLLTSGFFGSLKALRTRERSVSPPASDPGLSSSPGAATSSDSSLPSTPRQPTLLDLPHSQSLPTLPSFPSSASLPRPSPLSTASSKSLSALPSRTPKSNDALTAPSQLSLPSVLLSLDLAPFEGRLHSGLADTRNAARILVELARRGVQLLPNRTVPEGGRGREKSWAWMGRDGQVHWDEFLHSHGFDVTSWGRSPRGTPAPVPIVDPAFGSPRNSHARVAYTRAW
ncbi:hypothetical protein RQP46_005029 [Phenoliferia psychrophenolica]